MASAKRIGSWLLCILLTVGIAAEGILLHRRITAQPPADTAETESESVCNPEQELLDTLRSEDYDTAALLLAANYADTPIPEAALSLLQSQADAAYDAYTQGISDAAAAQNTLRRILAAEIAEVSGHVTPLLEKIRLHEAALSCQKTAAAYAAAGDYPKAMAQYALIPKTEQTLYADAQTQIEACAAQYQAETAAAAEEAFRTADYETAETLLKNALQILPESDALQSQLEQITQRQQSAAVHTALQAARQHFDAHDYTEAIAALEALPDTEEAQHIAASYRALYLLRLQTDTLSLLHQGDTDAAAALLAEAETLYPDAAEIATLQTELVTYLPVALSALNAGEPIDFSQAESPLRDLRGTEYSAAEGNLYCSYDGTRSGRQSSSAEFDTNGGYSLLTLTAAPLETFSADAVLLEISGDGRKIEAYTITRETGALPIRLDISGVRTLRIRVLPIGQDDLRNAGVIIADANVKK